MLLSAAFPVGLWRVRGRLHQSLYLKSSNHGNCTVLMYESNKKMSGHQNLSKTSTWQAETWLFLSWRQKKRGSSIWKSTWNWKQSYEQKPFWVALRTPQKLWFPFEYFDEKRNELLFYLTLLFRSLAESDCQHHNYFSVYVLVYIEYCADLHNTWSSVETTAVCYC